MTIELLFWDGCPSHPKALADLREAMSELGLDPATVHVLEVRGEADAERERFVGSPTIRIDGPVPTERVGYRFFLQPPAMSATVAAITGLDAVSDHPGVDTITVHQGPGADLDWKDGSRNHIMAVVGSAEDYTELQAVNRLLHKEVTVTYADVSHF